MYNPPHPLTHARTQAFFWTDWVRGTYTVLGSPMRLSFIGLALQAFLSLLTAMLLPRINRRVGPVLVYFVGQFIAMLGLMLALVTGPGPWSIVAALMMAPGYVTHTNNCYIVAFRALESPSTSPAGVGPAVRQQQQGYDTLGNGDGTTTNPTQPCVHENKGSVVAAVNMAMPAAQIVVGGLAGVALHAVGDDPGRVLFGIGLVGAIVNVCVGAVVVPNLSRRKPPHHHHHKSRASARRASA
jgi:Na+/melibiose symporter-like transporter